MNLAAVVLAAGSARRFGSDKLSAPFRGAPLLHHAIKAARAAPVERVIVVCRKGFDVGKWPGSPRIGTIEIESAALSTSLKAGIAAAAGADAAFIFLGDMPCIPPGVATQLADTLGANYAAIPRHNGRAGHPVLLSAKAFPDIARLSGDEGAGRLLRQRSDVAWVDCADPGILLDVDRRPDLERLNRDVQD